MSAKSIFYSFLQSVNIFVFFLFFSASFSQAELTWEQKTVRLEAHPLQMEAPAVFRFTNTGTNEVEILSVRTTCGCLKASVAANRIAPGESSMINVIFNLREKTGPQRKGVAIRSSDDPHRPTILYLESNLPVVYAPDIQRLEWPLNGGSEPKTCRFVNQWDHPVRLTGVSSSSEQFAVELKTIREGFEYEVLVRPVDCRIPVFATITVQTECPPDLEASRTYSFNACLK